MPKFHKLIKDMPINEYHSIGGTWSSSQFKDLLDDPDIFIKKHVEKVIEREEIPAFDVGSYFHTGTLEPHKLKVDCIVYPGKVRRGKDWEKFKAKHKGKAIVTQSQEDQAKGLIKAVADSPCSQEYLDGVPEVSLFVELVIVDGTIYAPHYGKKLTANGWVDGMPKSMKTGYRFNVKVRADMLGSFSIADLKSTTGNAKSNRSMRKKISDYEYDLSAALYMDIFGLERPVLATPMMVNNREVSRFAWIFASKDIFNCRVYHASLVNYRVGRAKYMTAMNRMANLAAAGWQSVDYVDVLEPLQHELEWLNEKDTDLL